MSEDPRTDWIRETPIAHRGLHDEHVPENSITAFERAIDAGYAIELDVRLSADGVPVVFHDPTFDRMTGTPGPVHEHPFDRMRDLQLLGTASRIPSLTEVLEIVDGRTPLLVEVKNHGAPGPIEPAIRDVLASYDGPFAVQSFNPRSMGWFRKHEPAWPRGQVSGSFTGVEVEAWKKALLRRLMLNVLSRPDFIAYENTALPYWPVALHRKLGLPVLAWTVRSADEHERIEACVDNVIFEGYEPG